MTADGEALLAAVIAAPDDNTPRLVYADWLEDHGDAARAEFIRRQVHGENAERLLSQHRAEWSIPGLTGVQTFRRGFVRGLYLTAEEFLANADRIGRLGPVADLRITIAIARLGEIAAVPWLSRIEHLDLTGNVGFGSRLEDFFLAANLPKLASLELRNCQLWPEHAAILGRLASRWPKLARLNLSGNPLGDDGAVALAASPDLQGLHELLLRCDEQSEVDAIHEAGTAAIAEAFPDLRRLDLNGHYIGNEGFLRTILSDRHSLEFSDASYNEIGREPSPWFELREPFRSAASLRHLILDGNRIEVHDVRNLTELPLLRTLECLSLSDCDFDDDLEHYVRQSDWRGKIRIERDDLD